MKKVFLGIGTNLGNRENNLREAFLKIRGNVGEVLLTSSVYETSPWGFDADNDFLNMVMIVQTICSPSELLERILKIESMLGRVRNDKQYSSRIIDIDILLYEDEVIEGEGLIIPHPMIHKRKFVLVPLCEIAPEMVHPVLKKSFTSLLNLTDDTNRVTKYK